MPPRFQADGQQVGTGPAKMHLPLSKDSGNRLNRIQFMTTKIVKIALSGVCLVGALVAVGSAEAITVFGSASGGLSAEADVTLSGSVLTIDLKNTGVAVSDPAQLLM